MRRALVALSVLLIVGCGHAFPGGAPPEVEQTLEQLIAAADSHQATATQVKDDAACRAELARYDATVQPLLEELQRWANAPRGCRCCGTRGWAVGVQEQVSVLQAHVASTCQAAPVERPALVQHHCVGLRQFAQDASR